MTPQQRLLNQIKKQSETTGFDGAIDILKNRNSKGRAVKKKKSLNNNRGSKTHSRRANV